MSQNLLTENSFVACFYDGKVSRIVKVERVTATQAILPGGIKVRREYSEGLELTEIGAAPYSQTSYEYATAAHQAQLKLRKNQLQAKKDLNALAQIIDAADAVKIEAILNAIKPLL